MKTITTEQFNALPEERRKYWKKDERWPSDVYTPIQINLEDAERVLEEAMELAKLDLFKREVTEWDEAHNLGLSNGIDHLTTALNNLKQLTK